MTNVAEASAIATPPRTQTLTIQLTPEDSARLAAVAQDRQIDAIALAQTLLHDSLATLLPVSPVDIESLEKLYSFREPSEVLQFLEQYPFLVSLALEAREHIRKHFPNSTLFIKCINDPEIDNPQLAIYITRPENLNAEERIDLLERIDDDWWLDAESRSQGKMFIGFE